LSQSSDYLWWYWRSFVPIDIQTRKLTLQTFNKAPKPYYRTRS
jgi:hypothetical protein